MRMNHLTHNVGRLLSLLLVVAALAGLLTVGALADEATTPTVTLEVKNVQQDGDNVTAEVWATGTADGKALDTTTGIVMLSVQLNVSDGLTLTKITKNAEAVLNDEVTYQSADIDDGLIVINAASYTKDGEGNKLFVAWTGGLVAKLTFSIKSGAFGKQTIGFADTEGTTAAYGVGKDSYTFALDKKSGSVTLPSATLKFDMNGHGTDIEDRTVAPNKEITMPTPADVEGYTFGGWYTESDCNNEFDSKAGLAADAVQTVYAKWTANQYDVTFDPADGKLPDGAASTKKVTYDSTYGELPTPTRDGFKFGGWMFEEKTISSETKVETAGEHTLTAKWVDKYEITIAGQTQKFTVGDDNIGFKVTPSVGAPDVTAPTTGYTVYYTVDGNEQTAAPSKPGSYNVRITRAEDDDFKAVDVTIENGLVINKKSVAAPTQGESSFTYNGSPYKFIYTNSTDSALYTKTAESPDSATDAGTYTVTFKLNDKDGYQWATKGNSDDLVFTYTITKAEVTKPTLTQSSFEYNGKAQTVTLNPVDAKYTLDTTTATATKAGDYEAKVTLTDSKNYKWAGETEDTIKLSFTIAPKKVELNFIAGIYTYDGKQQTYGGLSDTDDYTVTGHKRTEAGSQSVTVSLTNKENTVWKDSENNIDKTYTFTINPKTVTAPTVDDTKFVYNGSKQTYTIAASDEYVVENNTRTDAGYQTVTVSLKNTTNYQWADGTTAAKEYDFTIAKADQAAPTGLDATAETIFKKGNGEIAGVSKDMEYSSDGENWTSITDKKLEGLAAGKYFVRYAADDNHNASPAAEVEVAEGTKLTVTFNTNGGTDVKAQTGLGVGDLVEKPETTRTGYTLVGWYTDKNLKDKDAWDFATAKMGEKNIDLYAKWSYSVDISDKSFTTGSEPENGITIVIGGGLDLKVEDLGSIEIGGKKLPKEAYTVTITANKGLTITLSKEYLATLSAGVQYDVSIVLDGKETVETSFAVNEKEASQGGTTTNKPVSKNDKKAPRTGDSSDLLLWSVVTLGAGAGLVCIGKKRREN